ncbi:MAG TPA: molybdenum cofactor biosynthesis protein MoaE [Phototrophicaceae bacterium]|nr:molybdenum cofactor biosynthesis protein MoaE [Phototrophicaceae bacterium]
MSNGNNNTENKNKIPSYNKNRNSDADENGYQFVDQDPDIKRITSKEINVKSVLDSIDNNGDFGATVIFIGTVRNYGDNGQVMAMSYEAYVGMAEERIKNIEIEVKKKWDVKEVRVIHRVGDLKLGDNSITIAISTPHSKDAYDASQFILNKIKQDVPIWKNEKLLDGNTKWVRGKDLQRQY